MTWGTLLAAWATAIFIALNTGRLLAWVWTSGGVHPVIALLISVWFIVLAWSLWRTLMQIVIYLGGDDRD